MTGTQHAWIWATLQEMASLAAEQDAVAKEAKRLAAAYDAARQRVAEAIPDLSIEDTVNALRLIGAPPGVTAPSIPAAASPSPDPDPLALPTYLRRGEGSSQEDNAPGATQANEVA